MSLALQNVFAGWVNPVRLLVFFLLFGLAGFSFAETVASETQSRQTEERALDSAIKPEEQGAQTVNPSKDITASSVQASKVTVSEASNWPFVMLTLLGMIACILIIAWLVRRFTGLSGVGGRDLKVITAVALGTRERIAIVDVKGQQFLIGVTPQNINLLHHFDEAPINQAAPGGGGDFAEKLQKILGQTRDVNSSEPSDSNGSR